MNKLNSIKYGWELGRDDWKTKYKLTRCPTCSKKIWLLVVKYQWLMKNECDECIKKEDKLKRTRNYLSKWSERLKERNK